MSNVHLPHLEDLFLEYGFNGMVNIYYQLLEIPFVLRQQTSLLHIGVKYDGNPSIVCGTCPKTGQFFVATKSFFNKTPKLFYSEEEVHKEFNNGKYSPNLAYTMETAYIQLKKLGIKTILQGDLLYVNEMPRCCDLYFDSDLIVFHPNTIIYGVNRDSHLGNIIAQSKLGIVFHTEYDENLKPNYEPDISALNSTSDVWYKDASFIVNSPIDISIMPFYISPMEDLKTILDKTDPSFVNKFSTNRKIKELTQSFFHSIIRQGISPIPGEKVKMFYSWINDHYAVQLSILKKPENIDRKIQEKNEILHFLNKDEKKLNLLFQFWYITSLVKTFVIGEMNSFRQVPESFSYDMSNENWDLSEPEGYVISDGINATKWVNRLKFSHDNFNNKRWN